MATANTVAEPGRRSAICSLWKRITICIRILSCWMIWTCSRMWWRIRKLDSFWQASLQGLSGIGVVASLNGEHESGTTSRGMVGGCCAGDGSGSLHFPAQRNEERSIRRNDRRQASSVSSGPGKGRSSAVTPATGCAAIKTCLRPSRNANCKMIPTSAACLRRGSSNSGSVCSISPTCRRSSNCACSTAWKPGSI